MPVQFCLELPAVRTYPTYSHIYQSLHVLTFGVVFCYYIASLGAGYIHKLLLVIIGDGRLVFIYIQYFLFSAFLHLRTLI